MQCSGRRERRGCVLWQIACNALLCLRYCCPSPPERASGEFYGLGAEEAGARSLRAAPSRGCMQGHLLSLIYPVFVQVNLWGLDAIKTKGESVAIVLHLVGARPVREGTGRIARFELVPLEVSRLRDVGRAHSKLSHMLCLLPQTACRHSQMSAQSPLWCVLCSQPYWCCAYTACVCCASILRIQKIVALQEPGLSNADTLSSWMAFSGVRHHAVAPESVPPLSLCPAGARPTTH